MPISAIVVATTMKKTQEFESMPNARDVRTAQTKRIIALIKLKMVFTLSLTHI